MLKFIRWNPAREFPVVVMRAAHAFKTLQSGPWSCQNGVASMLVTDDGGAGMRPAYVIGLIGSNSGRTDDCAPFFDLPADVCSEIASAAVIRIDAVA